MKSVKLKLRMNSVKFKLKYLGFPGKFILLVFFYFKENFENTR